MTGEFEPRSFLRRVAGFVLALAFLAPTLAHAQFSDSFNFLKAVRDRDGAKVTEFVDQPGTTVINTRDGKSGETALHIVVARRDAIWVNFLLAKGAKPNFADNSGTTPLMLAAQLRFLDGARLLLANGAQVDKANDRGETPLIRAVQLRDLALVRLLIANGANPDKSDSLAGMSARDYAKRDNRTPAIVAALEAPKPVQGTGEVQGPK
ncbi:ankyrin repeat domain-containing protein [Rhizorhapis suberifaciens]|uniref:Ankyrin repeat protein n=1 Tax=Rhizorhapis suberifaciens TaxID=13656 RepID=A0A840HU90_9SPHN|nr:ankyrin repeat domain-containing protein [Rhizorhapis suberifaciens]MBB4641044.1 ankyrin repeat protein [Rhizorhapis suberifaciens]